MVFVKIYSYHNATVWTCVNNVSRTFFRKADNQIAVFPFLIAFSLRTVKDAVRYPHRCYWYLIRNYVHRTKDTYLRTCEKTLHVFKRSRCDSTVTFRKSGSHGRHQYDTLCGCQVKPLGITMNYVNHKNEVNNIAIFWEFLLICNLLFSIVFKITNVYCKIVDFVDCKLLNILWYFSPIIYKLSK